MTAGTGESVDIKALPKMVRWYSPSHLVSTGWRSVVSEIFGQYADQRIMQATIDGFSPEVMKSIVGRYDYSDDRQFGDGAATWVDYVADLGDGFDSTYAMASLISAPSLDIKGAGELPGGKLLIMGGDQVYPYPTRKEYYDRLVVPYSTALPAAPDGSARRKLFAVPGNHDWYDGLNSFDFTFCKARFGRAIENRIGGWQCPQHRSYFALRLPHNWWIWGADIQLAQYLDAGQVLYFEAVAEAMRQHPTEAPKLILCTAEPSWLREPADTLHGEGNLNHIVRLATESGARICVVLAGDLHHYCRYNAPELGLNFFTAGGGGAYFSPTHYLKKKLKTKLGGKDVELKQTCKVKDGKDTGQPTCWPSRGTSRRLSLATLAFPFRNYGYAVCLGVFYWLMTWLYSTTKIDVGAGGDKTVAQLLIDMKATSIPPIMSFLNVTFWAAASNVLLGFLSLVLWLILFVYADSRYGLRTKAAAASLHWLAHVAMMITLFYVVQVTSHWVADALFGQGATGSTKEHIRTILVFPLEMVFLGGIAAGMVWGLYLTVFCLFGLHSDQAFASMGIPNFKNFLRMKIEPDKLTIYPIGLRKVPKRSSWRYAKRDSGQGAMGPAIVPRRPLKPELIEGPIEIRVGDVKGRDPLQGLSGDAPNKVAKGAV